MISLEDLLDALGGHVASLTDTAASFEWAKPPSRSIVGRWIKADLEQAQAITDELRKHLSLPDQYIAALHMLHEQAHPDEASFAHCRREPCTRLDRIPTASRRGPAPTYLQIAESS